MSCYANNVPLADERFDAHLERLDSKKAAQAAEAEQAKQPQGAPRRRNAGGDDERKRLGGAGARC